MPLFARGLVQCAGLGVLPVFTEVADPAKVFEHVNYSHYSSPTRLHPSVGATTPAMKAGPPASYTWHKNPRYRMNMNTTDGSADIACEVGPIARMLATALAPAPYVAPTVTDTGLAAIMGGIYPGVTSSIECATNLGSMDHLGVLPALGGDVGAYTAGGLVTTVLGLLVPALVAPPVGNTVGMSPTETGIVGAIVANPLSALFSTLGRHGCRGLEAKYIMDAVAGGSAVPAGPTYGPGPLNGVAPASGYPMIDAVRVDPVADGSADVYTYQVMAKSLRMGQGLTEAPRGALAHWITSENRRIVNYQAVVPSTWNACGKDDGGQMGPIEQTLAGSLVGTVAGVGINGVVNNLLKAIHPFDICVACSVHVTDTKGNDLVKFNLDPDGKVTIVEEA